MWSKWRFGEFVCLKGNCLYGDDEYKQQGNPTEPMPQGLLQKLPLYIMILDFVCKTFLKSFFLLYNKL